jgi:glyoxylase-like metal-dependent hydrolase (beta-lactamase superfamily II)
MKITKGIFQVGGAGYSSLEDAAVYLINFGGHAALVDAGCGHSPENLLHNIESCGVSPDNIEYLLITHCHFDHTGGVSDLQDVIPFQIVAHDLEAPFLEQGDDTVTAAKWYGKSLKTFHVDRKLSQPREFIKLGDKRIEAIHTPGHSPGSVVYVTESDGKKILFGQDVHGPINPLILSDPDEYQRSLQLLISIDADILCEGHFGIYKGKTDVKRFIESFIE